MAKGITKNTKRSRESTARPLIGTTQIRIHAKVKLIRKCDETTIINEKNAKIGVMLE